MSKKDDFNHFQANAVLRAALKRSNFDITQDPGYPALLEAEKEKEIAKNICMYFPAIGSLLVIYKFGWRDRIPIHHVIGRCSALIALSAFTYAFNPAMRKYNNALMDISLRRKDDLKKYLDENRESLDKKSS